MLRIIKAELYRLFNEANLKIMVLITLLHIIIKSVPIYEILEKIFSVDMDYQSVVAYGHNAFLQLDFGGFNTFFVPFLIANIFSSEFAKKTMRNIAALKIKREDIFLGKYIVFAIMVFMLLSISAIFSTVLFTIINGWGSSTILLDVLNIVSIVIRLSIVQIAYASVIVLLALFIESGAMIIGLYLGLSLAESIVASIFQMLGRKVSIYNILSYIFPSSYMYAFPQMALSDGNFVGALISLASYIILTMLIGSLIMKRKDIKC